MADKSNIIDFRDRKFSSILQTKLNQYRKEKNLTDVELQIGAQLFPAHRAVLSAGSPVLEAAFSENWTQSKIYPIGDEYVDPEIVEDLLNFLYTGSIQLTSDNVHPVCVAAHFLQIPTLLKASVKGLSKQVTLENVLTLFVFSNSRDLNVLRRSCLRFISANYSKVFQNSQILQLSSKDFTDLIVWLKSKCSGTTVREDTFDCVVRWTEMSLSDRSEAFPVLLEHIPLEEVSFRFLTQTVFTHTLVKESFPCIQNILKTLKLSSIEAALEPIPSTQDLIVIGGRNFKTAQNIFFSMGDTFCSVMSYYHADSQTWRRLPDMLQKRRNFAVTVSAQRDIIVSGGCSLDDSYKTGSVYYDDSGKTGSVYYDDSGKTGSVEMFSWETHTWQKLPDMPVAMMRHSMTIHNGDLYVAIGMQFEPKVLRYSFEKREWSDVQPMWAQHYDDCLISYKNHLYSIGGLSCWIVERYDPEREQWTQIGTNETTGPVKATVHQDKIYVAGLDAFGAYDPETNAWTFLPVWPIVGPMSLVSLNGKLLVVSRDLQRNYHSVCDLLKWGHPIYEYDFSTDKWRLFDGTFSNYSAQYAVVGDLY